MSISRKIIYSVLCAIGILLVTWKYQNYDYTLALEDAFFKKVFFIKDKIYSPSSKTAGNFVFVNTGKDLALIEDTTEYGNVAISDRRKIYELLHFINSARAKPTFCVVDIQFYYPFTCEPVVDSLMQVELRENTGIVIPVVKNRKGEYWKPMYDAQYGYSDYRTFGAAFNKFRIMNEESIRSIPILLDEKVNHVRYRDHFFYPTFNDTLCLSAIWPSYYIKDDDIVKSTTVTNIDSIGTLKNVQPIVRGVSLEYFNIGELLYDIEADPKRYATAFANKILIVGNFGEDVHTTPVGKMTGPVLLANVYLSLANRQQIVSKWFILLLLVALSGLSYVALFSKIPEVKFNFKFMFSSYVTNFIKTYISYFGAMFVLSLIALALFNVQVALFLPSLLLSGIEYIKKKKYLELK
jgi:hypothetical protein